MRKEKSVRKSVKKILCVSSLIFGAVAVVAKAQSLPSTLQERADTLRGWDVIHLFGGYYNHLVHPADGPQPEDRAVTDAHENNRDNCPTGMVRVNGQFIRDPRIEAIQDALCEEWSGLRCMRFHQREFQYVVRTHLRDQIAREQSHIPEVTLTEQEQTEVQARLARARVNLTQPLETLDMHYCIDRFEFPNQKFENPWVTMNWNQARQLCAHGDATLGIDGGKRLCNTNEWVFACEGEQAHPYPFGDGFNRHPEPIGAEPMCNIDQNGPGIPDAFQTFSTNHPDYRFFVANAWRGRVSGSMPACRSTMGVYDLVGNVDEWTIASSSNPRSLAYDPDRLPLREFEEGEQGRSLSMLKGGFWNRVRTRCRPTTIGHGPTFNFYQVGFRCCTSAPELRSEAPNPRR